MPDARRLVPPDDDCTPVICGDGHANVATGEPCDKNGWSAIRDAVCASSICGDGQFNAAAIIVTSRYAIGLPDRLSRRPGGAYPPRHAGGNGPEKFSRPRGNGGEKLYASEMALRMCGCHFAPLNPDDG